MKIETLRARQAMPLEMKIQMSLQKIREWYHHWSGEVYCSFSGGKDSTVLLHLVRQVDKSIPAVFVNTGLEYPEVREFVKTAENVVTLRPEKPFQKVIKENGYPIISKKVARQLRQLQNPHEKNVATRHLYLTGETRTGHFSKAWKLPKKYLPLIDAPFKNFGAMLRYYEEKTV